MKTIGLIGGMSWESTATYYAIINRVIKCELGGFHSAKCLLYSVDFHEIEECQSGGDWEKGGQILAAAARVLENAGAEFIVICTNTMQKAVPQIQEQIKIPILHIAEATAKKLREAKIEKVALFGTKYTMEQDFYKNKLIENGIEVLVPEEHERNAINDIIYKELCLGVISQDSKAMLLELVNKMSAAGAEGVILGCTEIGLLISQQDTKVPLYDTTLIHAREAALNAVRD